MQPETQLLLRNHDRIFRDGPFVVIDPPDLATIETLRAYEVDYWCRDYATARALHNEANVHFGAQPSSASPRYQTGIIFLPKGRRFQEMTFAQAAASTVAGGRLFVVGANNAGIKSARRSLESVVGKSTPVDSARRCGLIETMVGEDAAPFAFAPWTQRWDAAVGAFRIAVETIPGTFSGGELDAGTMELMTAIEGYNIGRRVLDMCCGSGVIGAMLARHEPDSSVTLVDTHACAIESAARTLTLNQLRNASTHPSDWFSDVSGRFDTIVCNPPFHQGVATDMTMASSVIRGAPEFLETKGELWLVANRFLPYLDELHAVFGSVVIARETRRFRVYRCSLPTGNHARQLKRRGRDRKR